MTTATLFNDCYTPATGRDPHPAPLAARRIVIVGGGTAGWMTALLFARSVGERGAQITLLESPTVGIIGVGEGSTPWLRGFFDSLGIEEAEWMPACHATYKCGITFDGWSTKPGFERYFHPFASMLDNLTMRQFVHNADARVNGANVHAHPDRFFIATRLAAGCKAPKPAPSFPFDVWHGYHFDAVLLGQFLHKKALERGVRYHSCHVTHANLRADGSIASVAIREGESIEADLFVDCSGFAGLLIEQALHTPYLSFAANLFNDAAVAMPTPIGESIPSQTFSTALKCGWAWKIPLTERFGNGYVYSSRYCSAEQAERELREHLGLLEADVPARHLKMKTGRVSEPWNRNCLAIGLAGGFIEPLEATALYFIQRTVSMFLEYFERGELGPQAHRAYNEHVAAYFEGTRDYIVTHFKTSSRKDSDYWRDNAANMNLSDDLKKLYALWMSGKSIAPVVAQQQLGKGYPVFSWYAILAGMGIFPDREQLRPPSAQEARYPMEQLDDLLGRSSSNYPDHRAALAAIAPRRTAPSLQAYFF
jgi:tryptophan 6-halogenase